MTPLDMTLWRRKVTGRDLRFCMAWHRMEDIRNDLNDHGFWALCVRLNYKWHRQVGLDLVTCGAQCDGVIVLRAEYIRGM